MSRITKDLLDMGTPFITMLPIVIHCWLSKLVQTGQI